MLVDVKSEVVIRFVANDCIDELIEDLEKLKSGETEQFSRFFLEDEGGATLTFIKL